MNKENGYQVNKGRLSPRQDDFLVELRGEIEEHGPQSGGGCDVDWKAWADRIIAYDASCPECERLKEALAEMTAAEARAAGVYRVASDRAVAVTKERDAAIAEVERLREKNRALNERATKAEGIIDRSGIVEARPQGAEGRSMGRALANYAAARYERERDAALATAQARDEEVKRSSREAAEFRVLLSEARDSVEYVDKTTGRTDPTGLLARIDAALGSQR